MLYLKGRPLKRNDKSVLVTDNLTGVTHTWSQEDVRKYIATNGLSNKLHNLVAGNYYRPKSKLAFHYQNRYFLLRDDILRMYILQPDMCSLDRTIDLGVVNLRKTSLYADAEVKKLNDSLIFHIIEYNRVGIRNLIYRYRGSNLRCLYEESSFKSVPDSQIPFLSIKNNNIYLSTSIIELS